MASIDSPFIVSPDYYDTWNKHNSVAFRSAKGLQNAPGENNCFVNSAVQVFWHLDVFRRSYRRISGHTCMGNSCIFCSLKVMFTQFQYSDKTSLTPEHVRTALAETFADQHRFQLGHMDDAAECFENILRRIHYHLATDHDEDHCSAPHCIPHQKFAMTVFDQLICPCGAKSEPHKFHELVHYISANSIVSQAKKMHDNGEVIQHERFGLILRHAAVLGDYRNCPKNCGEKLQEKRTLLNFPDVVSIGLIWHSDRPNWAMVSEVVNSIGTDIQLQDVFHNVICEDINSLPTLHLSAVVCYYGKHYSTFIYHSKLQSWIYFDDTTVKQIGPDFDAVKDKCSKSRFQPLLLLYTNPNPTVITGETAMKKTVMAEGFTAPSTPCQKRKSRPPETTSSSRDHHISRTVQNGLTPDVSQRSTTPLLDLNSHNDNNSSRSLTPAPVFKQYILPEKLSQAHARQQSYITALNKQAVTDSDNKTTKHKTRTFGGALRQKSVPSCNSRDATEQNSKLLVPNSPNENYLYERNMYHRYDNMHSRTQSQSFDEQHSDAGYYHCNSTTKLSVPSNYGSSDLKRSPVESGLATLPRRTSRSKAAVQEYTQTPLSMHEREDSTSSTGSVVLNPAYKDSKSEYVDQSKYLRQSSMETSQNSDPCFSNTYNDNHIRQISSSTSGSDITLTQSHQDLTDMRSGNAKYDYVDSAPSLKYINRKMVENVLCRQKVQRQPSTASSSSYKSASSSSSLDPTDFHRKTKALLVNIHVDNISLESHKDSGYASSDRNSSSSTGSTTMDPYAQYFLSKGMIPPQTLTERTISHNISEFNTRCFNNYAPNNTRTSNSNIKTPSTHVPNLNSSNNDYSSVPYRSSDVHNLPHPAKTNSFNHQTSRTASPISVNSHVEDITEKFDELLDKSDNYMDSCILAETSGDISQALSHCRASIDCLDQLLASSNLSNKRMLMITNMRQGCVIKQQSLDLAVYRLQHNTTPKPLTSSKTSSHDRIANNNQSKCLPSPQDDLRIKAQQMYEPRSTTGMLKFVKTRKSPNEQQSTGSTEPAIHQQHSNAQNHYTRASESPSCGIESYGESSSRISETAVITRAENDKCSNPASASCSAYRNDYSSHPQVKPRSHYIPDGDRTKHKPPSSSQFKSHAQIANRVWTLQRHASQPDCTSLCRSLTTPEIYQIDMPFLKDKRDMSTFRSQPDLSYQSDGEGLSCVRQFASPDYEYNSDHMTVKDLSTRFESTNVSDSTRKKLPSKCKKQSGSSRKRSKSVSRSEAQPGAKPTKHADSVGSRKSRKCVTFSDKNIPPGQPPPPYNVAVGIETENRYTDRKEQGRHKTKYTKEDSESDSPFEEADNMCALCNKRGALPYSQYCSNCSFYLSQFQQK